VGRLQVRVQPRSGRNEIAGERYGRLLLRVSAAPVDGKANDAVRRLLAKRLGVAPGRVAVARGQSGRDKLIDVEGIEDAELLRRLRGADA
jgi:uncharacterized protein YggU (UPF0235/DUF167 family)